MTTRSLIKVDSDIIDSFCATRPEVGGRAVPDSDILFQKGFPVRVVQHYQVVGAMAEVHLDFDDLWLCLEGEASFVCGGRLVEPIGQVPNELTFIAPAIVEGEVITLKKGDWLLIPAGRPHQPITLLSANLAIIKLPAREKCVRLDYLSKFKIEA